MARSSPAIPKAWLRRRRRRLRRQETSFCFLTFRVGSSLALFSAVVYQVIVWYYQQQTTSGNNFPLLAAMDKAHQETRTTHSKTTAAAAASASASGLLNLPPYNFSIFERYKRSTTITASNDADHPAKFEQAATRLIADFLETYTNAASDEEEQSGGETRRLHQAQAIIANLLSGSPSRGLAQRLLHRSRNNNNNPKHQAGQSAPSAAAALTIWIAGSSAAAGYGNAHSHSYGSLLGPMLQPLLESLDVQIHVVDTSMKDLTEFPSTWCLAPPVDAGVDVIVYDFGEERATPHLGRFEAFLRHVILAFSSLSSNKHEPQPPPLLVVRGLRTAEQWDLLQYYAQQQKHYLDVLIIRDNLILPNVIIPDVESALPIGFQSFEAFGVRASPDSLHAHNLSVQQHRLVAWLLVLHVLGSLAFSLDNKRDSDFGDYQYTGKGNQPALPPSKYLQLDGLESLQALFSHTGVNRDSIHCRTSYMHSSLQIGDAGSSMELVPSANSNNTLTLTHSLLHDIIIDGLANPDHEVTDLLLPKTEQTAHRGWVLSLDAASKRSKLLLRSSGDFLGFQDWKMAYYGVPQSGPLQLFLPLASKNGANTVSLLMVCQDDAAVPKSCLLHRDATFWVQGQPAVNVTHINTDLVAAMAGEPSCVQVHVDPATELLQRTKEGLFGIHLNITVTNPQITWKNGPCSVAHTVWATRAEQ